VYEKTTCQNQIEFITDDYLQMYKTLQLFKSLFKGITNIYKHTKTHLQIQELLKMTSHGQTLANRMKPGQRFQL
jgi:hypothetical protein